MGSAERGPGRGLALAASADWQTADLPAALQGGARRAIFRGLYKGAEAAARRPGSASASASASARDGEGRGDTHAGSWDAEAAGLGPSAGLRPSLRCLVEARAPGACVPRRGGVACRRPGGDAAGLEVKVQTAGLGCLLEEERGGSPAEPPSGVGEEALTLPTLPRSGARGWRAGRERRAKEGLTY